MTVCVRILTPCLQAAIIVKYLHFPESLCLLLVHVSMCHSCVCVCVYCHHHTRARSHPAVQDVLQPF